MKHDKEIALPKPWVWCFLNLNNGPSSQEGKHSDVSSFFLQNKNMNAIEKTTNQIENEADNSGTKDLKKGVRRLEGDYVNEQHVKDFMEALVAYDGNEYISTWTDSFPLKRPPKRKLKEQEAAKPKGISHLLLQYPLVVTTILQGIITVTYL